MPTQTAIDLIQAEFERRFELAELRDLARDMLGPQAATLARASSKRDLIGQLLGALQKQGGMLALRELLGARLPGLAKDFPHGQEDARAQRLPVEFERALELSSSERLGAGRRGHCYLVARQSQRFRLKVYYPQVTRERERQLAFAALTRHLARCAPPQWPERVEYWELAGISGVCHAYPEGALASARLATAWSEASPFEPKELAPWLRSALRALEVLHQRGLAHGNLSPSNIAWHAESCTLLDAFEDRLASGPLEEELPGWSRLSPERLLGGRSDASSDLFTLGAVALELLVGAPAVGAWQALQFALESPARASRVDTLSPAALQRLPAGWVRSFLRELTTRDPKLRPARAEAALARLEALISSEPSAPSLLSAVSGPFALPFVDSHTPLQDVPEALGGTPTSQRSIASASRALGSDSLRAPVAPQGAVSLQSTSDADSKSAGSHGKAEHSKADSQSTATQQLAAEVASKPAPSKPDSTEPEAITNINAAALKSEVTVHAGEILDAADAEAELERLLALTEQSQDRRERARFLGRIGQLYEARQSEPEQALFAYTQALCENPFENAWLSRISALVGERESAWLEVLSSVETALADASRSHEERAVLARRGADLGRAHVPHADLTLRLADAARALDPEENSVAAQLEKQGAFQDLLEHLKQQIERADTPRKRVALQLRLAELYEVEFLDGPRAAAILEQVLEVFPAHEEAATRLAGAYRRLARFHDLVALCERRLQSEPRSEAKLELCLESARVLEGPLGDPERAERAYQAALELAPECVPALEGLSRLAEARQDPAAARYLQSLATHAASSEARAQSWVRAARSFEHWGKVNDAIESYKRALDADANCRPALRGLVETLKSSGDLTGAASILERDLEHGSAASPRDRSASLAELSLMYRARGENERARRNAKAAIELDGTNYVAARALADLEFDEQHHSEAARWYSVLLSAAEKPSDAGAVALRHIEALLRAGQVSKAIEVAPRWLALAPGDLQLWHRAAGLEFEHGSKERAVEQYDELLRRFSSDLPATERTELWVRLGQALESLGRYTDAVEPLERALRQDPQQRVALGALGRVVEKLEQWLRAIDLKLRLVALASGEERVQLLLEVAELWASKLGERNEAISALNRALESGTEDRRVLTKLMQLHGEAEHWPELSEVVLRLLDRVDEPQQRVKYLHTVAIVTARHLGDIPKALTYYARAIELAPDFERGILESLELQRKLGDWVAVEQLLRRKLDLLTSRGDQAGMVRTFDELAELYQYRLLWPEQAVDAYEAAQTLDFANRARSEVLERLYMTAPAKYLERAVASAHEILRKDPFRSEPYRMLRRLYVETGQADAAYCVCQALTVLNLASAEEKQLYESNRSRTAVPALHVLSDDAWLEHVMHADADPLLTSLFALIEAAVIAKRSRTLAEFGYDPARALSLAEHPSPLCQSLFHAASVLGITPPLVFASASDPSPGDPGSISFLFTAKPAFVLGPAALSPELPLQHAAFVSGQSLAYLRPGMYLRQLLSSGTALKAWFFATIQLTAPAFPVVPEIEGAVREAAIALEAGIVGPLRDHLTRVVAKLVATGAELDLKRWVTALDFTADRAGLIACHDLKAAINAAQAFANSAIVPGRFQAPLEERLRELIIYSVSPDYLEVRRSLGVGSGARSE